MHLTLVQASLAASKALLSTWACALHFRFTANATAAGADFCARCTTWDFGQLEQPMKRQAGPEWSRWTELRREGDCWRPCSRCAAHAVC